MKLNNIGKLIISLAIPQLAGLIGSLFTRQSIPTWYAQLEKPFLNPPSWIFWPVWTLLFILIGIALFLVWKKEKIFDVYLSDKKRVAYTVFAIQMFLNTTWSIIFFGFQNIWLGFANIILLWVFILWNIISFHKISRPAAYLLIPYLLWVSFASYLNIAIGILNS